MSYILDALKKAERERDKGQPLEIKYYSNNLPSSGTTSTFQSWLLMLLIFLMNIAFLVLLLWPKEPIKPPRVYIMPLTESPSWYSTTSTQYPYQSHNALEPIANSSVLKQEKLLSLSQPLNGYQDQVP